MLFLTIACGYVPFIDWDYAEAESDSDDPEE
jgi:hypothetical protein